MLPALHNATVSDRAVSQSSIDKALSGIPVGMLLVGDKKKSLRGFFLVLTTTNARCNGLGLASGEDRGADN